jgi:hypothetical protein
MPPPEVWGPAVWTLFHTLAEKINVNAYPVVFPSLFKMIVRICKFLPCPECSKDASNYLAKVKLSNIRNKTDFKNTFYIFHNWVNAKKRKQLFNYSHIFIYSRYNLIQIVNNFISKYQTKGNMKLLTESFQRQFIIKDFSNWFKKSIKAFFPSVNIPPPVSNQNIIEPETEPESDNKDNYDKKNILDLNKDYHILDENDQPFKINLKEMIQLHKYLLEHNESQQKNQKNIYEQILLQQQLQQEIQQQMLQLEQTKNTMSKQIQELSIASNKNNDKQQQQQLQMQQEQLRQAQIQQEQLRQAQIQAQTQQQLLMQQQQNQQKQQAQQQMQQQQKQQQQQENQQAQQQIQKQQMQQNQQQIQKQQMQQNQQQQYDIETDSDDVDLSDDEIIKLKKQLNDLQKQNNELINN